MSETTPNSEPIPAKNVHLIDHTIIQSGALFRELLRLYQGLADGRKNWSKTDLGRLRFRIELVCILSAAISPALRHTHLPIALRMIQLQVFCDMVTQTGRLALCEARPFLSFSIGGKGRWPNPRLGLAHLAKFVSKRKSELSDTVRHSDAA